MSSIETTIAALADRIVQHSANMQTEEAVKTSFVLPFLQALGYDVFDPSEVVPEYTADTPGKRGEKVDYAIVRDKKVAILIECKGLSTPLNDKHLSQLFRYFSVTEARFAILTNGREYRFYSDLEAANRMDKKPFFTFDVCDHSGYSLAELASFSKSSFNVDVILEQAERLKYVNLVKGWIAGEMESPSDELCGNVSRSCW
ncbi:type I restriction enzyme HsdR N-terminal domain-containing protein [Jannaschia sp. S6380]|uniref:type I restriction endonuclease n=1 Tax=Jannaschia sp. S6380 TaxID=2926408 RepID=UPI001FF170E5|nr:type I restriction endonuclease [Jannaschia sp. S6380]MCK0167803.1 type I restriction enzyme HsdR N-terminal domain-containing protein [Jannaschia sp. S6380]